MNARELYPDAIDDEDQYGVTNFVSYKPIIESFGKIVVQVDDDDWSGDTRVLLEKDGRYGFLNFGWGSCSGCDVLYGAKSYEEVDGIIEELRRNIKWFDSLKDAANYIADDVRKCSYYFHGKEWAQFVELVQNAAMENNPQGST